MSLLAPPSTPNASHRRMTSQARVASNVLGTPWPTLWGMRDLSGTLVAWTNHRYSNSGGSGKGGGQVSSGEKDYRTFALGLCIGPVDRITAIWYDNQLIWQGNVSIASAAAAATSTIGVGGVVLTDNNSRGTIALYFGLNNQTQDPVLAQFIPDAPFYRGLCYAVFHGPRTGTLGFRIGNADTLAQIAVRVERIPPAPPGTPFDCQTQADPGNAAAQAQAVSISTDLTNFTGSKNVFYRLSATAPGDNAHLQVVTSIVDGVDSGGTQSIENGVAFNIGTLGLKVTLSWPSNSSPPLNPAASVAWSILVTSESSAAGGANVAGMVYELLSSDVHGFALNPALIDAPQFAIVAQQLDYLGLAYATTEKGDVRTLLQDILKNVQGALIISNGKVAPRLLGYAPGSPLSIACTLESDDLIGLRQRPGAWYELPAHVVVKFRDVNRLYRDTIVSLPSAGDYGNDEKQIEIDLPMVTNMGAARIIGSRLRALECLPKKPDTITCGRNAFPIQFGDVIAINDPLRGYDPSVPLAVIAVREHGVGDESIELDVAPNIFGFLPISGDPVGTGPGRQGGGGGGGTGYNPINYQSAFECPFDFATDGSKRFVLFAARSAPDAQGFSLWASIETPAVDFDDVDPDALFHPGGTIRTTNYSQYTMDRDAWLDFDAASDDIDSWQSVSDTDWFAYKFLILAGDGNHASLYAAKELVFLGGNRWRVAGLFGPLSDTPAQSGIDGQSVWIFRLQPLYSVSAEPSWVNGSNITFKGIPFGSRLSPSLGLATAALATVESRAIRPRAAVNPSANGRGAPLGPTYSADIALSWDLCNRAYGFGAETNPSEFDPSVACEVSACDVDVVVSNTVVHTANVPIRAAVTTSITSAADSQHFSVVDATGLQPGDRISVIHDGGEWFGRIASISGSGITLVSPLSIVPSPSDVLNRYESIGYIYDQATNEADNGGSLPSSVVFNIYPKLNGLRSLNPAQLTVNKQ